MTRIVTGLFSKHRDVDLVVEHLVQEFDIPRERVQVHALDAADAAEARSPQDSELDVSLPELGLPEEAARACDAGMRDGGILVAAWVDDGHVDRVLGAYREYGATGPNACEAATSDAAGRHEQRIRIRAYHLWEQAGRPGGRDAEFWEQARRAVEDETSDGGGVAARAPQEFAGETGAAPLPERHGDSGT